MTFKTSREKFTEWFCNHYSWMLQPPIKEYINKADNVSLAILHIYNGTDKTLNGKKCLVLGLEKEEGKYNYFNKDIGDNHLFRPIGVKLRSVAETLFDICSEKLGITLNQNFAEAYIDTLSTEFSEIIFAINVIGIKRKWWYNMNQGRKTNERLENKYFTIDNINHIPIENITPDNNEVNDLVKQTLKLVNSLSLDNSGARISSFKKYIM